MAKTGRPIGATGKRTLEAIAMAEKFDIHPLQYLMQRVNDTKEETVVRADCAKAALPYILPRLTAIDVRAFIKQDDRRPEEITRDLNNMLEDFARRQPKGAVKLEDVSEVKRDLLGSSQI